MTAAEQWREIPGYKDYYEVSNRGRVRSLDRRVWKGVKGWHPLRGKILRGGKHPYGYPQFGLSQHGKVRRRAAHKLVLEAFVGPCPEGLEACHRDGDPTNNRLKNLYWGTHSENVKDAVRHGTHVDNRGQRHGMSKLSEKDVRQVRQLLRQGHLTQKEIAERFGVGRANISSIHRGKSWSHIL